MLNDLKLAEKMLVCPVCTRPVLLVQRKLWCTGTDCRRSYPIDDEDIPHMLGSESTVEETAASRDQPAGDD